MARPKEALIDRKTIINASIKILERDGLEGFSLRNLAGKLSVNPASFYHYFEGKEAILRAAAGQILREVEAPPDRYDWQRWMVESSIHYWRLLVRKPFLAPIMLAGFRPETAVGVRNAQMMTQAGISPTHQDDINRAFEAFIVGSALIATSRPIGPGGAKRLDPEETLRMTLTLMLAQLVAKVSRPAKVVRKPERR